MGPATSKSGSLEKHELEKVKNSWNAVMKNPEDNAVYIFKTFLDKHDYYSKFPKFSNIPIEELPNNKTFRHHASSIVRALNNVIQHVENESVFRNDLVALGKIHGKKSITEEQFQELKAVILDILKKDFNLPEDSIIAWTKTFDIAYVYMFEGLRNV